MAKALRASKRSRERLSSHSFTPWDPLKLSDKVDGPHRTVKASIKCPIYRSVGTVVLYWDPMAHRNAAFFTGGDEEAEVLLRNLSKVSKNTYPKERRAEGLEVHHYRFGSEDGERWVPLEEEYPAYTFHPQEGDLPSLIKRLWEHRERVRENSRLLGFVEAPNKKVQCIILHLRSDECDPLFENDEVGDMIVDLLRNSANERLYFMILTDNAVDVPLFIHYAFDVEYFIGEENLAHGENEVRKGLELERYDLNQVLIGGAYYYNLRTMYSVYPMKRTNSQYLIDKKADILDEEAAYREFLASLSDGTE